MIRKLAREYRVHWKRHILLILIAAVIGYAISEMMG